MVLVEKNAFAVAIKERLAKTDQLPAMPEMAHELLLLRNKPNADVSELVSIISRDPSLSAQIMRYAHSAYFGFGKRITSLQQAITVVMGFDTALHMTLGFAAGKFLKTPVEGPIGRRILWQHSLSTATLAQALAACLPADQRPARGLIYLAGLLHDFGLLLFGHWYPNQFTQLSKLIEANPDVHIREMELYAFGISHDTIGRELMKVWGLPEEIITTAGEHHFPDYDGKHAIYVKLVALANRLLEIPGMQDSGSPMDTATLLETLNISEEKAQEALAKVRENDQEFQEIAAQIAG